MRPNRIGVFPVKLNDNNITITSSRRVLDDYFDSTSDIHGNMTPRGTVELYSGVPNDIHSTIYSRQWFYGGQSEGAFRNEGNPVRQRFSIGGFITLDGLRTENAEGRPLYVRMVGYAECTNKAKATGVQWLDVEPVIGFKENSEAPSTGYNSAARESRRLSTFVELPTAGTYHEPYTTEAVHSHSSIDTTFALADTFTRSGGRGIPQDSIIGVGWSFLFPTVTNNETFDLIGPWIVFMSCWIYTSDLDMFDPNKN